MTQPMLALDVSAQVTTLLLFDVARDPDGHMVPMVRMVRPTGQQRVPLDSLATSHWTIIDEDGFRAAWIRQADEAAGRLDVQIVHAVSGLLLPVWASLPDDDVRVWRLGTPAGQDLLARIIPPSALPRLYAAFGMSGSVSLSPAEMITGASQPEGSNIPALDGARLIEVRVNGAPRLELRGFAPDQLSWLKSIGCFTEIIAYKTRLFIPRDRAKQILATIDGE